MRGLRVGPEKMKTKSIQNRPDLFCADVDCRQTQVCKSRYIYKIFYWNFHWLLDSNVRIVDRFMVIDSVNLISIDLKYDEEHV